MAASFFQSGAFTSVESNDCVLEASLASLSASSPVGLSASGPWDSPADKSSSLLEDLDLLILTERLRLLDTQRELAAIRCQRFTDMLEASLAKSAAAAVPARAFSIPEDAAEQSDEEGSVSLSFRRSTTLDTAECFSAAEYYARPRSVRRHSSLKERRRGSRKPSSPGLSA